MRKKQFIYKMLPRHSPRETDENQVLAGRQIRLTFPFTVVCNTARVQNGKFSLEKP
jgi:hypothetical protein